MEETRTKRKPGRRLLPPTERKSRILKFRAREDLVEQMQSAARASGRSVSEEIEHRLSQSFDEERHLIDALALAYGARAAGLLLTIAEAMKVGSATELLNIDWLDYPHRYRQASLAAQRVLDAAAPDGDPTPPPPSRDLAWLIEGDKNWMEYRANRGTFEANRLLDDITMSNPQPWSNPKRPLLRRLLGEALVSRISKFVGATK